MSLLACLGGAVACATTSPDAVAVPDGSAASINEVQRASAGIVGCRPNEISLGSATYEEFHEVWELQCPTGRWICSRQDKFGHEYINCAILSHDPIKESI